MTCSNNIKQKAFIKKNNLKITYYKPVCDYLKFGSILDWIPVYVSNTSDFILYNLNTNSPHYKKLAYCYNNNGFYISYLNQNIRLDSEMDIIKMESRILNCIDYEHSLSIFKNIKNNSYDIKMLNNNSYIDEIDEIDEIDNLFL